MKHRLGSLSELNLVQRYTIVSQFLDLPVLCLILSIFAYIFHI